MHAATLIHQIYPFLPVPKLHDGAYIAVTLEVRRQDYDSYHLCVYYQDANGLICGISALERKMNCEMYTYLDCHLGC